MNQFDDNEFENEAALDIDDEITLPEEACDYYYCVMFDDLMNCATTLVTPIDFYEQHGYCYDQHILPYIPVLELDENIDEVMEGVFIHEEFQTKEELEKYMNKLGFIKNEDLLS